MCELLFILQRISVTNIILSNNVYNISTVHLLLRSLKFGIIYTWSFSFFFLLLIKKKLKNYVGFCCCFLVGLPVPLNGIKKYLA